MVINMARFTLVLVATLWCLSEVCEGSVKQVVYNERDLVGHCKHKCEHLPHRTNKLGCERISNCRRSRRGRLRGFVRCDFCMCDCQTSTVEPVNTIIKSELDLWGKCSKTCYAPDLQRSNAFGCSEVRDCQLQRKGWQRWFVRCDYCECTCVP